MSTVASPRVLEKILENGLKVAFVPAAPAPVATLMVVYRVGSRNEAVGYTGSSHLLEHMLFKGTPANNRHNGRAFADMMNEIGANKNASTWIDRTNYFETVPSGYLDFAIELEADRMRGAWIAEADRHSEMTVVRNELERSDTSHDRVLNSALVATAFREHPYHHPTIGWRSDVEGVSTERLRSLYDTYYHPGNATAFVVGDVDVERTLETVERHFGSVPRSTLAIPEVYTQEPPQSGERSVVVKRPGDTTIVALAFHVPAAHGGTSVLSAADLARRFAAPRVEDADFYALEVLGRILGRGRTSRLSRALVDTHLALDASAWNWGSRDPGLFEIFVHVVPGVATGDIRRELDRVLAALARTGPSPAEVRQAQTQIAIERAFARDGTLALAQRLCEFEAVGSWRLDEDLVERVQAVTVEQVREVTRRYLNEDNRSLGMLVPGVPATFDVVPFEAVDGRPQTPTGVEAAPLPASRRTDRQKFAERIVSGVLSPNVTWRYVASPESPTVHVRGILDAGAPFAPEHPMLATIVAEMLSRGTRSHERQVLEERLEGAGIRRAYFADDDRSQPYNALAFRFSAACAKADLPLMLATLGEEMREPAFHERELALVKADLTGSLLQLRTSTGWRAAQSFSALAYEPGDPNYLPDSATLLADVEAIRTEDVAGFYRRIVLGAPLVLAAAGGAEDGVFAALVARAFEGIPFVSRNAPAELVARCRPAREARGNVSLERKANVDVAIGRATSLVRTAPDYLMARVANGILGQSTLSSRLGLRLRDREGLTYGVTSAFLSPARLPGPWRISLSVNPANVERAIASARAVVCELVESGPTERELTQQRNSLAGQHQVGLATNAGIAAQLERIGYYGLGADDIDTYPERVAAVTRDEVRTAIGRYFAPRDLIVVAAGTLRETSD